MSKAHTIRDIDKSGLDIQAIDWSSEVYLPNDRARIMMHLYSVPGDIQSNWVGADRLWFDTGQTTVFLPLDIARHIAAMVEERDREEAEAQECAKAGCNGDHTTPPPPHTTTIVEEPQWFTAACTCGWEQSCMTRGGAELEATRHDPDGAAKRAAAKRALAELVDRMERGTYTNIILSDN